MIRSPEAEGASRAGIHFHEGQFMMSGVEILNDRNWNGQQASYQAN